MHRTRMVGAMLYVAFALELAVLAFVIVRVRRAARRLRALRRDGHGLPAALELALREVVKVRVLANLIAVELSTMAFAVTGWFRSPPEGFTMHRRAGLLELVGVIAALAVIEAVAVHIVVVRFAPTLAFVLTALSAYGLLWLVGMAQAARLLPLRVTERGLVIERGVTRRVFVPAEAIAVVKPIAAAPAGAIDLSYVEPNVLLELASPVEVHGLFGRTRVATTLALSVDDREAFLARLGLCATRERADDRVVDRAP